MSINILAIKKYFKEEKLFFALCLFFVLLNTLYYGYVNIDIVSHFDGFSGYDLSIADQGIWLLSRFEKAFVTIRGLHIFGDHTPYIYLFLAPLYWIFDDIRILLFFHSLLLSLGAVFVFLISRHYLFHAFICLIFSILYLIYIPLNYLNLELIFCDAFATTPLLAAFYFMQKNKLYLSALGMILTLLTKEDFSLIVSALSIYCFFFVNKKFGITMLIFAICWMAFNFLVLLPYFNGYGYFRHRYGYAVFGQLGNSAPDVIKNIFNDPSLLFNTVFTEVNINYFLKLISPLVFLPIIGIEVFLIALVPISINMISAYYYTHFIEYHYTATIIPFIFVSTILGVKRISVISKKLGYLLILGICFSSIYNYKKFGPQKNLSVIPSLLKNQKQLVYLNEGEVELYKMIKTIPADSSVSVSYDLLPHFSHRKTCYCFPMPFKLHYWGINGENMPSELPNYLFLDKHLLEQEHRDLIAADKYNKIYDGLRAEIYQLKEKSDE